MASFTKKNIRVTIRLGTGSFSTGENTLVINDFDDVNEEGLAVEAVIAKKPKPDKNDATVKIYNLSLDHMRECTNLGFKGTKISKNEIQVDINNGDGLGYYTIYKGDIITSYADFSEGANAILVITARTGGFAAIIPAKPLSVKGSTAASQLFQQWASEMEYSFKNNGVSINIKNSIFNGTAMEKSQALAEQIGIDLVIDDNVMYITPKNKVLNSTGTVPYLSKETGMLGYPVFTSKGIACRCLCNPNIQQNRNVQIQSIVPGMSGTWRVSTLTHNITAHKDGKWETAFEGVKA